MSGITPNNTTKQIINNAIVKKLNNLETEVNTLEEGVVTVQDDISDVQNDIQDIQGNIETIQGNISDLNGSVTDINAALEGKQSTLTFDNEPRTGSNNPVKSGGIYNALETKLDKESVKFDPEPNGTDALSTGGAYDIVQDLTDQLNDYKRNLVFLTTDADGEKVNDGTIVINNNQTVENTKAIEVRKGDTTLKDTSVNGDLSVSGDETVGGSVTVTNDINSNNVNASGDLTVSNITASGDINGALKKSITVTDKDNTTHTYNNTDDVEITSVLSAQKDINGDSIDQTYVKNALLGNANGVATLDENGRLPYSQLPESAMELKGLWDASTNTPTLVQGVGTNGDFYIVSVGGTQFGESFNVNDRIIFVSEDNTWHRLPYTVTANVTSVNGKIGAVTLYGTDIAKDSNDSTTVSAVLDNILNGTSTVGKSSVATKLETSRSINGTSFDGSSDITTSKWGTARTITVKDNDGTNSQSNTNINGSANFDLKLPSTIKASITGSATSAGKLTTARKVYVKLGTASTSETKDFSGDTAIPVDGTLAIANGGTGATSASGARTNLGLGSSAEKTAGSGAGNVPLIGSAFNSGGVVITDTNSKLKTSSYSVEEIIRNGNLSFVCSTAKNQSAKTITITGSLSYLPTGFTCRVMFTNGNSGANPTLAIGSISAKAIKVVRGGSKIAPINKTGYWRGASNTSSEMWQDNTILDLMYDGTDWVIIGNPVVESYYSGSNGYSVYADGKIECWGRVTTTVGTVTTVTFPIKFSQYPCFVALSNEAITSSGSSRGAWTESYCNSISSATVYVKGTGSSLSTPTSWQAIGY